MPLLSVVAPGRGTPSTSIGGGVEGNDNPDSITEASTVIFSRDYETEDTSHIANVPNIALRQFGAHGYDGTNGWRLQCDAIDGPPDAVTTEDQCGWAMPTSTTFTANTYELVVLSLMFKISQVLVDEIAAQSGGFWAHDMKTVDCRWWNTSDDGPGVDARNGWFFGEDGAGGVRHGIWDGGAGARYYHGPDFADYGDVWCWMAFLSDMRGATPQDRFLATYLKFSGDGGVTRIGRRFEDGTLSDPDLPDLNAYEGHGFHGFNNSNSVFGYWDDQGGGASFIGSKTNMHIYLDRVRITDGWPTGADGPPF